MFTYVFMHSCMLVESAKRAAVRLFLCQFCASLFGELKQAVELVLVVVHVGSPNVVGAAHPPDIYMSPSSLVGTTIRAATCSWRRLAGIIGTTRS
jgi:hypothetical protein